MRKRIIISTIVLIVTGVGAAWVFGWFRGDQIPAEIHQMQAKLADPNLKDADRQSMMQQMRSKMESLSPDARRAVWDGNREMFEKRMSSHVGQLLAMSLADRNKALDADIDRMEKARAQMQNAQSSQQKGPPRQARTTNLSDDQRVDRLRNRLDRSTPEMRATRTAYMQMINDRRQQRGLPPMTGRGGR
jgi:hypothetical protein